MLKIKVYVSKLLKCCNIKTTSPSKVRFLSSGETFSVVAIPTNRLDMYASLSWACTKIASILVPASDPKYGMRLTWNEPDCTSF